MVDIHDMPIDAVELATADMKRPKWCPFANSCLMIDRLDVNFMGELYRNDDEKITETCIGSWFEDDQTYIRECQFIIDADEPVTGVMSMPFATHYMAAIARAIWRCADIQNLTVADD